MPERRQTTIAVLFDYDYTLTKEWCEDPVLRAYGINTDYFWKLMLPEYIKSQESMLESAEKFYKGPKLPDGLNRTGVNMDMSYIGLILKLVREGPLKGLSRGKLRELGQEVVLCDGVWKGLEEIKGNVRENSRWNRYGVNVEYYIVSSAPFDPIIGGLGPYVEMCSGVYGNELIPEEGEDPLHGELRWHVGHMFDTVKTRPLFEILKGSREDVNRRVSSEEKQVKDKYTIAVFDGFTDVPLSAVVEDKKGVNIGVWAGINPEQMAESKKKAEDLLAERRAHVIFEADYRNGSALRKYLEGTIGQMADEISWEKGEKKRVMIELPFPD